MTHFAEDINEAQEATILVVDDNEMNRDMLSRRLRRRGYHVLTAASGEDALQIIADNALDLVLLDIMMPGIDGISLLRMVREEHSMLALPIVMVTAKDETEQVVRALAIGANDYLTKPIDFPIVLARVRTQLQIKRLEEYLQTLRQQAVSASEAKSQFLASISHEIRTPVNAIMGMSDLLQETTLTPQQKGYVQVLTSASEALLALVDDVLDLSKIEAGRLDLDLQVLDVHKMMDEALRVITVRADEKGLRVEAIIDDDVPAQIQTDPTRLRQVLINLLSNAVKFTHDGGVTLTVDCAPEDPETHLRITVADTGIGIPHDKQARIFDMFEQADTSITRRYGGTGLGLSISRRLVELMGGTLHVESEVGKGSTFTFTLAYTRPDAILPSAPIEESEPAPQPRDGRALNILLAEDVRSNRAVLQAFISRTPHHMTMVENGSEAVAHFREGEYDLVLMDVDMPVMDGLAATRAIRDIEREQKRPRTPVIALTGFARSEDVEAAREAGCTGHLTKPVRKRTLLDTISALGGVVPEVDQLPDGVTDEPVALVDPMLREIVPEFLTDTRKQLDHIERLLDQADFLAIAREAHKLKGVGGSYGFPLITEHGETLEKAAEDQDRSSVRATLDELGTYVQQVRVIYNHEEPKPAPKGN